MLLKLLLLGSLLCFCAHAAIGIEAEVQAVSLFAVGLDDASGKFMELPIYEKDVIKRDFEYIQDTNDDSKATRLCETSSPPSGDLIDGLDCDDLAQFKSRHPLFSGVNEIKTGRPDDTPLHTLSECDSAVREFGEFIKELRDACEVVFKNGDTIAQLAIGPVDTPRRTECMQPASETPLSPGYWVKHVDCRKVFVSKMDDETRVYTSSWKLKSEVFTITQLTAGVPLDRIHLISKSHKFDSLFYKMGKSFKFIPEPTRTFLRLMVTYFQAIFSVRSQWLVEEAWESGESLRKESSFTTVLLQMEKSLQEKQLQLPPKPPENHFPIHKLRTCKTIKLKTINPKNTIMPRLHTNPCDVWQLLKSSLSEEHVEQIHREVSDSLSLEARSLFLLMLDNKKESCATLRPTNEIKFHPLETTLSGGRLIPKLVFEWNGLVNVVNLIERGDCTQLKPLLAHLGAIDCWSKKRKIVRPCAVPEIRHESTTFDPDDVFDNDDEYPEED